MKYKIEAAACRDYSVSSRLEWILPNGMGGFAMGSVAGSNTRRYHGHLVAATAPPTERMVLLAAVEAYANVGGTNFGISTNQYVGTVHPQGYATLESFTAGSFVEWVYMLGSDRMAKRLQVHNGENAVTIEYHNLGVQPMQLTLRPLVSHKFYHDNFRVTDFYPQFLVFPEGRTVLTHDGVKLCLEHSEADRTPTTGWYYRFEHVRESERGLDPLDDLYCPCELRYILAPGQSAVLVASTDEDTRPATFEEEKLATDGTVEDLLRQATRLFLVESKQRTSIIAGYPWFTDWGRDTMISLPGICLCNGLYETARSILRSYASAMDQGLVPNRFTDDGSSPEYNTADATLWFVNAISQTLKSEWDEAFAIEAWEWLTEIRSWHENGTRFGIGVDASDGLLRQGTAGVQLTWMDAKVGDWVVTPRHGKPVEVNGLWINALRVIEWLGNKLGKDVTQVALAASKAEESFTRKFWKASLKHYLDTVEPDDASLRPNQLVAMALEYGPAKGPNASAALKTVRSELLTANGLRTLGTNEPGYRGRYEGTLSERDATYHQGTCWPWLIGPYVSAVLRIDSDIAEARQAIGPIRQWLESYGLGGIAEVYDGDSPQFPNGCPWQAWSVAEALRAWVEVHNFETVGTESSQTK